MFSSSGRIQLSIQAARTEFDAGIEAALGELKRVIRSTTLDPKALRQVVGQRLQHFAADLKAAAQMNDSARLLDPRESFAAFDKQLDFALEQFDVGLHDPIEPEVPQVSNAINIGSITGTTIQQGSPNASQNVRFTLNIQLAQTALDGFETAINEVSLSAEELTNIKADLQTICPQLSKPSPSLSIIQESGRTIRSVIEGVAAGLLTPSVIAAAPALWSALGLS